MKIYKKNSNLIVEIPLKQKINNPYMDDLSETNNLVGIIAGQEYTLSQLIDLNYKGDQQEGMPILHFGSRKELEEVCKKYDIDVWEHPICAYCDKPIRGCHTYGDKGNMCMDCE